MCNMANRHVYLLFLFNLLIFGGIVAHHVNDAFCDVIASDCVTTLEAEEDSILHGNFALLSQAIDTVTTTAQTSAKSDYLNTWHFVTPPRLRPPA